MRTLVKDGKVGGPGFAWRTLSGRFPISTLLTCEQLAGIVDSSVSRDSQSLRLEVAIIKLWQVTIWGVEKGDTVLPHVLNNTDGPVY